MKRFFTSKKFRFLILALIGIGLFVYFFLFPESKIPEEIRKEKEISAKTMLPISSVYRYDFEKREYISDEGGSWQNSDFTRYIYDLAPESLELERCYYFLYDNTKKEISGGGQRKCNTNLTIIVGENKDCLSQGESACTLYVYTQDNLGNQGEMAAVTYYIDWEVPKVGKIYQKDKSYLAEVLDNLKVSYCWLYLNNQNVGPMKIENGIASLKYPAEEEESYTAFVRCADHYDAEEEKYLNLTSGELVEIGPSINYPPKISSCRVIPTQGTTETSFRFEVEASDPEGDSLTYSWDFGDGDNLTKKNPTHQYKNSGTYEPKITVFDQQGEKDNCSTAWVVVSEE